MDREAVVAALALRSARGVGDRVFKLLVERFGSADAALKTSVAELLGVAGLSAPLAEAIREAAPNRDFASRELDRAQALGIGLVPFGSPGYPRLLAEVPDPPAVLYLAGQLEVRDEMSVAIVGSRGASPHGTRFARKLARDLASAGITVVSGLAQGVDAAAHQGALDAGGRTLAVFGSGLDVIFPRRHGELARRVRSSGVWVSELALGSKPLAHHFPRRNRVISGLSLGVVVIEAGPKSGSLITASCALDQGRDVFAVPGLPGSHQSRGAHELLRSGAKLVERAEDVLVELPVGRPQLRPESAEQERGPPPGHEKLWKALDDSPSHIDEIGIRCGLRAAETAAGLMELVLSGHAEEWPGKRYARKQPD